VLDLVSKTKDLNKRISLAGNVQYTASDLAFYNRDGSLTSDVWILASATNAGGAPGDQAALIAYDTSGTATIYSVFSTSCDPCSVTRGSMAFGQFTNKTAAVRQACVTATSTTGAGTANKLACFDISSSSTAIKKQVNSSSNYLIYPADTTDIIAYDADSDGYTDIVTGRQVLFLSQNRTINWSVSTDTQPAIADFGDFNSPGILGSATGMSTFAQSVAVTGASMSLTGRDLDRNFRNHVCVGSTVIFTARNAAYNSAADSSYLYNTSATAYLYSTCGTGSVMGPFDVGLPGSSGVILSCLFNESGDYTFDIFITKSLLGSNPATDLRFSEIVTVRNETGFDCNEGNYIGQYGIVPLPVGAGCVGVSCQGLPDSGEQELIGEFVEMTTGGTALLKAFVCLLATIAVIFWLVREKTTSPMIYAVVIFALWILLALMTLLSWIYVIIYGFVMIGATAVFFVKGQVSGGGGQ